MQPVRILLIGEATNLLRRLRLRLEIQGYEVTMGCGAPSPGSASRGLARTFSSLSLGRAAGRAETLRLGIEAYRVRRPLSVLFLVNDGIGEHERQLAEEIADLGLVQKPRRTRKVIERLESWYESESSMLLAG